MKFKLVAPVHYMYEHPRYPLPAKIVLDKGLIFTKFDKKLITIVTDSFKKIYSGYDIEDLRKCKFCVIYDFESKTESESDAQNRVHYFIESLKIIRPTQAACSTFLFKLDKKGRLHAEKASGKTNAAFLTRDEPTGATHFVTSDGTRIKLYYKSVIALYKKYSGSYNRVLNSFIFYQLGYLTHHLKLRIVPFATSLESLFNTSEQEIGYSLRVRCAAFLGSNTKEKHEIAHKIKGVYELRSAAVHGASFTKKVLKDSITFTETIRNSEELCRKCIRKIFDKKIVDIFSQKNDKLIRYLDNLVLD